MSDAPTADEPALHRTPLRRLSHDLRRRDWLGILIELAIVVLGILIAFQVNEWGASRDRAEAERQFLERLYSEYRGGVAELDSVDAEHLRIMRELRAVFAARDDPVRLDALRRTNGYGCGAARFRAAPFNETAYEELLSSGRLNIISEQRLRGEIRDLATAQASANRQVGYGRELVLNQLQALNPYYRFDIVDSGEATCFIDWAQLLRDQQAVNAIVRAYRVHSITLDERLKVKAQTERLLANLACKLGKPECRRS